MPNSSPIATAPVEGGQLATLLVYVDSPADGHFVATLPMPLSAPPLWTGDRLWARRHDVIGEHAMFLVSGWGDSSSIANGVTTLRQADPATDLPYAAFPGLVVDPAAAVVMVGGERLGFVASTMQRVSTNAAVSIRCQYTSSNYLFNVEFIQPTLHPIVYIEGAPLRRTKSANGTQTTGTLTLPGLTVNAPSFVVGVVGQHPRYSTWATSTDLDYTNAEVSKALRNVKVSMRDALPATWDQTDFGGVPYARGAWTAARAEQIVNALKPRDIPNATGADGSFGASASSVLWGSDRPAVGAIRNLMVAADLFCKRQAYWLDDPSSLSYVRPYQSNAHPNLTMHKGLPWIDDRSDPYDDLGIGIPRGERLPTNAEGLVGFDNQHEAAGPLVAATVAKGLWCYRLACQAKASQLSYDRNYAVAHRENALNWIQNGRGAGRPMTALAAVASTGAAAAAVRDYNGPLWCGLILDRMVQKAIPETQPVHVASPFVETIVGFTGYEEGLQGQSAFFVYRKTRSQRALKLARLSGRTNATTCYANMNGTWWTGYHVPYKGTGIPAMPSESSPAGPWLTRWSVAGLTTYIAASAEYATRYGQVFVDDWIWVQIALAARHYFITTIGEAPESDTELACAVNQILLTAPIEAFLPPAPVSA